MAMNQTVAPQSEEFQQALALHESGQIARAQAMYEAILKKQPKHADALHLLGLMAARGNDPKRAAVLIGKAIQADPGNPVAYFNRGSVLQQLKQWDAALDSFDKAIGMHPEFAAVYFSRGNVLQDLRRFEEALQSYNQAIAIQPDFDDACLNRGNLLAKLRQWDAALASYDQAIAIRPDFAVAYCNRGNVLKELNRLAEAQASYDKAISIQPDYPAAYANRGVTLLLAGQLQSGWIDFEWRWKIHSPLLVTEKKSFRQPLWIGKESLAGKTILLHSEQGFGDTLQFCRYVPLVAQLGAQVILQVQKPLSSLLSNLEGVSQSAGNGSAIPHADYHCPLLSLPLAFKTSLDTIPAAIPYLRAAAGKVAHWQARLGAATKPRIGLSWSGGSMQQDDNRRIPLTDLLAQLPADFQYVSLQKELHESDEASLKARPDVLNFAGDLTDFSETAALCECLDLVISVDTSVAHLSAALGKRTWILLAFSPDWRWLLNRSDSPWYPSATLYRQDRMDEWGGVLRRVAADLGQTFDSARSLRP
jgi:tetratricopeptide (TPR) repeat protein